MSDRGNPWLKSLPHNQFKRSVCELLVGVLQLGSRAVTPSGEDQGVTTMSGFSNKRASESAGKPRKKPTIIDLSTARQMLPLVRIIVRDIVDQQRRLSDLTTEQNLLDSERRNLNWESRQRRYAVSDERSRAEQSYNTAVGELTGLGVSLDDPESGRVDFPTRINGRPAAFTWQVDETTVGFWRYAGEETRRPIPADWQPGTALMVRSDA